MFDNKIPNLDFPSLKVVRDDVDMPVLSSGGYVHMKDLEPDASVMSHTGKFNKVIKVDYEETDTLYKIDFLGYEPVYSSGNLLFYVCDLTLDNRRFVSLKDIDADKVYFCTPVASYSYRDYSYPHSKDEKYFYFKASEISYKKENVSVFFLRTEKEGSYIMGGFSVLCQNKKQESF